MSCKMLLFDFRESEEIFFKKNNFSNFEIKFFKENYDLVLRITDGMMNSVYKGISKQLENEIKEELKRRSKK